MIVESSLDIDGIVYSPDMGKISFFLEEEVTCSWRQRWEGCQPEVLPFLECEGW